MRPRRLSYWAKLLSPMAASLVGLVILRLAASDLLDQQRLARLIGPLGRGAPLVYILLLALRPLTLLPGQAFTAVGGMLFGAAQATLYSIIGDGLALVLVFGLSHRYGTRLMRRVAKDRYGPIRQVARRNELKFALLVTINPLTPTDMAVGLAAAAGARMVPLLSGALLATAPGIFLTAQFGSALAQGRLLLTLISVAGLLVSLGLGALFGRTMLREVNHAANGSQPPAAPERPDARLRRTRRGRPAIENA